MCVCVCVVVFSKTVEKKIEFCHFAASSSSSSNSSAFARLSEENVERTSQSLERLIFGCVASSPTRSEESVEENRVHQSTGFARLRRRGDRGANDFRREMADEFVCRRGRRRF